MKQGVQRVAETVDAQGVQCKNRCTPIQATVNKRLRPSVQPPKPLIHTVDAHHSSWWSYALQLRSTKASLIRGRSEHTPTEREF